MSDGSDSLEVEHSDVECFKALPDDIVEAIGSTESAIRKITNPRSNRRAIADKFSLRSTRQMFNRSTGYMIIKLFTGAHETASRSLDGAAPKLSKVAVQNGRTVMLEVGVLELYRKLRADAEWWLKNSRGDVKLVIIVSISRETPDIKFETVALDPTVNYVPKIRQTITASRDANKPSRLTDHRQSSSTFDH
ncbi:hypothetical protein N7489_007630 [Penicillium chrysogenum]|uniref:Uncharacterized protein n=1 Tax=Penicillium chrysogenum TaxID=5076 RepID=A0ABQ8W718_PENCH|nr:uncharacterized protein N7489_007630 [Penicillium chrysogenum]KAJ5237539.1 hypothetical protein N7489_007630 [Penicillium chrysogenum]KAJ5256477.1 hypothetical protein N7505_011628 [Penicillium chrysogenum]KAJ5277690.1 hypothetical protein N7524_003843 [Penicillium chrysogenum]KAJ6160129.1 hypothetical protein N7497_004666 [Penicillium chrysogenum]